MSDDWRLYLPPLIRRLPPDLTGIVLLVGLTVGSVTLPFVSETPLRVVLTVPFLLFAPGYALVAALFPAGRLADDDRSDARGTGAIERVTLSIGLSVALVVLTGVVLDTLRFRVGLVSMLLGISAVTLVATAVGARQRQQLPPERRPTIPYRRWIRSAWASLVDPPTTLDGALSLVLVVTVLLAGTGVALDGVGYQAQFTEFYLLSENGDGDWVAGEYQTSFTRGEAEKLVVGVANHEKQAVSYTVVVVLQRTTTANGQVQVVEQQELRRIEARVAANESWTVRHTVRPRLLGEELRLAYLLYRGSVPANPSVDNAYRELHLWINVSNP